jgi:hypothetical protein
MGRDVSIKCLCTPFTTASTPSQMYYITLPHLTHYRPVLGSARVSILRRQFCSDWETVQVLKCGHSSSTEIPTS